MTVDDTDKDTEARFKELIGTGWKRFEYDGFCSFVGPFWERDLNGTLSLGFIADDRHKNRAGNVQGGMLATLADLALGVTARNDDRLRRQATIELNLQYIDSAKTGEFIVASCEVLRQTSNLAFMRGVIEADAKVVASISGVWRILKGRHLAVDEEQKTDGG